MKDFNGVDYQIKTIDGVNGFITFGTHKLSPKHIVSLNPPKKPKERFPVCEEQPEWTTAHTEQSI